MDRDCAVFHKRSEVEIRLENFGIHCESVVVCGAALVLPEIEGHMRRAGGKGFADRDVSAPREKRHVVGSCAEPVVGNTRAAMREIVPVAGPSSCDEWAQLIKGRFANWLDERRTILTRVMPQLNEGQIQDITTMALFTAATGLYDQYQSQGISGGLVRGAPDEQGEQWRANILERFARGAGDVVGRLIGSVGEVIIDFARGLMNTIVPVIQGWLIMILYAFFPIGVLISLLPGMHMKVFDYLGAIWWVKSWTIFLGLISHVLEALYRIRGGTVRIGETAEFVS